jgi:CheY-like chemotaxis protein
MNDNEMHKKILVVDDNEDLTWIISRCLLSEKEFHDVICANSSKEALNLLSKNSIDIVVSDIKMPEMSGVELLVEIKKLYPKIKVIIMTAYGYEYAEQETKERGALYYIEKPFQIDELKALIMSAVSDIEHPEKLASELPLIDVIRVSCIGRLLTQLVVEKDNKTGRIYLEDGNIIHAEVENLVGEKAFYEILSWDKGKLAYKSGICATRETINTDWRDLLHQVANNRNAQRV